MRKKKKIQHGDHMLINGGFHGIFASDYSLDNNQWLNCNQTVLWHAYNYALEYIYKIDEGI